VIPKNVTQVRHLIVCVPTVYWDQIPLVRHQWRIRDLIKGQILPRPFYPFPFGPGSGSQNVTLFVLVLLLLVLGISSLKPLRLS